MYYVGLMLTLRLQKYIRTLAQHRPNMLGQQRATVHLDIAPTLAANVGPTKCVTSGQHCPNVVMLSGMESAIEFREHCKEVSKDELDLIIKAELFSHRRSSVHTQAKKHKTKERERPYQEFYFKGKRVCRFTFCFIHGIERKKLQSIAHSLDVDGLSPRVHGGTGKPPKHALRYQDSVRIKTFLMKFATDNALPLPGRLPNYKNHQVLLLPSDKSTVDIYEEYESLAKVMKYRSISLRTFQRQWQELCPNIVITKPCTDLCQKCQDFANRISKSGNLAEEEKEQLLAEYNSHVQLAKEQRDYYREQVKLAKQNYLELPIALQDSGNPPQSVQTTLHYSWDFAQQVHIPHHAQQVGPIYFKTPRKCHVFGICSEGSGKQTFYLIDEASNPGKGANSVTSMVHHYFDKFGHGETDIKVHFDNCTGQNKNNVVLWYGLWRVLTGLHRTIEYSMMVAGHTKFEPDWHFGVWKVHWRNTYAETISQVAESVRTSSRSGHNIPQVVGDGEDPVLFYEWKNYLQVYFKPLKYLTRYHHFFMDSENPGIITCRENASSEPVTFMLLKSKSKVPNPGVLPSPSVIKGLEPARQWYLYDHIREHCYSETAKECICPKPTVPKKEIDLTECCEEYKPKGGRKKALLNLACNSLSVNSVHVLTCVNNI